MSFGCCNCNCSLSSLALRAVRAVLSCGSVLCAYAGVLWAVCPVAVAEHRPLLRLANTQRLVSCAPAPAPAQLLRPLEPPYVQCGVPQ